MDESRLKDVPLFASLDARALREVASRADEVDLAEGKALMNAGRFAYEFCVILDGRAEVFNDDGAIAEVGPGDFVGEMGVVSRGRRSASVVSLSPMRLVVMTAADLREISRRMPSVGAQIEAAIEERSKATAG
jgi:CRP-like cAMP-binding protein